MRLRIFATGLLATLLSLLSFSILAADKTARFEIQLLWGTDAEKSPNANHKPVEADVEKKLKSLPLKFKNYFLVNKKHVDAAQGETRKEPISEKCAVEIKNLGDSKFEISLFGKGEQIVKRSQKFPKGEILVLGGNAPNSTAWLVVLKRQE